MTKNPQSVTMATLQRLSLVFAFLAFSSNAFVVKAPPARLLSTELFVIGANGDSQTTKTNTLTPPEGPASLTFFDIDEECEGSHCMLIDVEDTSSPVPKQEQAQVQLIDRILLWLPIVAPLVAYLSYEQVAEFSDAVIECLSNKNFVVVDGGAYESKIIAPAINGVVVPSIAILFATLISETITSLRQRQQDIRTTINMEAGELRVLQAMIDAFPPGSLVQDRCRSYLVQYTSRLIAESQPASAQKINEASGADSEMTGFLAALNQVNGKSVVHDSILAESYMAVARLNSERSQRISSLQSTFPALHFVILTVLAASICGAFLLETNQDILIFLNAVQLKLLWAMLVGVFSALGTVCYDLADPFRGSYQISKSTVAQLYTIRSALRASARMTTVGDDMGGENEF
jgi:hypothetical protein